MRLSLLPDWHHAWKWSSVRLLAASGLIQTTLLTFPDKLLQYVPQWVLQSASTAALALTFLAALGRVTTTEKPNEHP